MRCSEKATDSRQAAFGVLWTYDGEVFRAVATRGAPAAFAEFLREAPPEAAISLPASSRIAIAILTARSAGSGHGLGR
jgi:DNA polymerase III sliding clamp (beta) subunit (PCNA family)